MVEVRILKDIEGGKFKKGITYDFVKNSAAHLVEHGFGEYVNATNPVKKEVEGPDKIQQTNTPPIMNAEQALIHIAILGKRDKYFLTVKNHQTGTGYNVEILKEQIISYAEEMNKQGYCVWASLNPKVHDGISGVTALADFWLDIDRPKATKDSNVPATEEELQEALVRARELQHYIENTYNAIGFLALSGNGYHLHFPLPITPIDVKQCGTVNTRVTAFAKKVARTINKEIDSTYDINRKTTLIGSQNLKIPDKPLNTVWDSMITEEGLEKALTFVETAREQNKNLIETILNTSPEGQATATTLTEISGNAKVIPELDNIIAKNITFREVFSDPLKWETYKFASRSEAEQFLVIELMRYGYDPAKVRETMKLSQVGRWNNPKTLQQYRDHTITKAAKFIKEEALKANPEAQVKERESQADRLYKLVLTKILTKNLEFFHDQYKTEYVRKPIENNATNAINDTSNIHSAENEIIITRENEREKEITPLKVYESTVNSVNSVSAYETVRLKDEKFKTYLSRLLYEAEEKVLNHESASQVITLLKFNASHGKYYNLYNRVAPDPKDGSIWLDMADNQNRAYHITKDGWAIETDVPILFRRYEHQRPLADAVKEGNAKKLLEYVKISPDKKTDDKKSKTAKHRELLLLVQTASYLIPEIAHPVNAMFGCPGSHKSTAQRFIREIFDPSAATLLRIPRDENAALQVLDHHYIPIFDNLDFMPRWFSEMLCGAVTGAGQESRALYTDDDSFIRSFRRCVMLNGLNLPATKGDLLNRTIIHPTEPSDKRRTEAELDKKYKADLPEILGGFLDLAVKALAIKDAIKPIKLFRLADFTEWGAALANALGEKDEDFIQAMDENLNSQNEADIENNVVADAFLAEFNKEGLDYSNITEGNEFKDTPDGIYRLISKRAETMGVKINSKKWPQAAQSFTRKLNDSKSAIIASGWNYEIFHDGTKRVMSIWRTDAPKVGDGKKPQFIVEKVKPAEMCSFCNTNAVEYSVKTPASGTQRRCEGCFNNLKTEFQKGANFVFKEAS